MLTIIRRATAFIRSVGITCEPHGNPAAACTDCVQDRLETIRRG